MAQISETLQLATQTFSLSEALQILKPLSLFVLGMAIYSLFIFKFYRYVGRRDIFKFEDKKKDGSKFTGFGKFLEYVSYTFKHVFLLPIVIFFWFVTLSLILAFLSKQEGAQAILLVSIALISTIRIMAYYNEDLSKDLAKMLPFALLGIFLVDISFFSIETSLDVISKLPALWNIMAYYFIFLIGLEILLRILYGIFGKTKTTNTR